MPRGCRAAPGARAPLLILAAVTLLLGASLLAPTANAAKVAADEPLPGPRVGSGAAHVGDGVFLVIGGRDGPHGQGPDAYLDEIVRYVPGEGGKLAGHLPAYPGAPSSGRMSMAVVGAGDEAYVFGGATPYPVSTPQGTVHLPFSLDDIIRVGADGSTRQLVDRLPTRVWSPAAVWTGSEAYVLGGFELWVGPDGSSHYGHQADIVKFDPAQPDGQRVTHLGELPFPVMGAAAAYADGAAWIFGGQAPHDGHHVQCPEQEVYNEETGQYETRPMDICRVDTIIRVPLDAPGNAQILSQRLPHPVEFHSATAVDGRIYLVAGDLRDGTASSSVLVFDPAERTLHALHPTLPTGRIGHAADTDGTDVWVFGGKSHLTGEREGTSTVHRIVTGATEPLAPRNLTRAAEPDGIHLQWQPPQYDGGSRLTAYRIYRITDGTTEELATVPASNISYKDTTAKPGVAYRYRVHAVNGIAESLTGPEVGVQAKTRAPSMPEHFRAIAGNQEVLLRWSPPTDDGGSYLSGYRVYRSDLAKPYVLPASMTEFVDGRNQPLVNGVEYTYRVSAFNGNGESPQTQAWTVTPVDAPPAPATLDVDEEGEALVLRWSAVEADIIGYNVYRGTEPEQMTRLNAEPIRATEFTDEAVETGILYHYYVTAVNTAHGEHQEGLPSPTVAEGRIEAPTAPKFLVAEAHAGKIKLTWGAATSATPVTYLVERQANDEDQPRVIAWDLTETTFEDTRVWPGKSYQYWVSAENPKRGPSAASREVTAKDVPNEPPIAKLSASPSHAAPGETITLDASLSTDPDGRIVEYVFDFGDGTRPARVTQPSLEYAYPLAGTYTATLTVVDDRGRKSESTAIALVVGTGEIVAPGGFAGDDPDAEPPQGHGDEDATLSGGTPEPAPGSTPTPGPGLLAALAGLALAGRAVRRRAR